MLINKDLQWNDSIESEIQQTFPDFEVMGACYFLKMMLHSLFLLQLYIVYSIVNIYYILSFLLKLLINNEFID